MAPANSPLEDSGPGGLNSEGPRTSNPAGCTPRAPVPADRSPVGALRGPPHGTPPAPTAPLFPARPRPRGDASAGPRGHDGPRHPPDGGRRCAGGPRCAGTVTVPAGSGGSPAVTRPSPVAPCRPLPAGQSVPRPCPSGQLPRNAGTLADGLRGWSEPCEPRSRRPRESRHFAHAHARRSPARAAPASSSPHERTTPHAPNPPLPGGVDVDVGPSRNRHPDMAPGSSAQLAR